MAIIRKGLLTVGTGGVAQNLQLGFVPNYFRMENKTKIIANTNAVQIVEWYDDMANASAYLWTYTTAPVSDLYLIWWNHSVRLRSSLRNDELDNHRDQQSSQSKYHSHPCIHK